ncbi:methionyl-tRNA synthetase [Tilletia horrida]|uniref:Probable methionine--tRNA ligase, mitochondrial n=1 Tax=Tilletia horrida TaxID=155126 RepID=A0AAN6GWA1_9BASI|nr:methionyl-tRNA synthetase [Tilletia horrida]KAK0555960.1 methionyl-tRNA synthetase [Tilletia horrida]KAK0568848.1 methionyl-tRNA synthetase [Tilletia horrida]
MQPAAARPHPSTRSATSLLHARPHSSTASSSSSPTPKPFYVTTPIFYVNANPHIGHLHSDLVADVLARYHAWRYRGWSPASLTSTPSLPTHDIQPVLSTGTDEHGLKIQKVAEAANEDPKALCDRISKRFKDLADAAEIGYTRFIRTTEQDHAEAVKEIWNRLWDGGYIYKGQHSGWYSVSDEAFYTEQQVQEIQDANTGEKYMVAIETGQRVEWSSEENYKFRLSQFRDSLISWLSTPQPNPFTASDTPDRFLMPLQPPSQQAALLAELQSGELADLSVSRPRSRLHWGIPVPGDEEHTIYVWIDALVNYLTVTGFPWPQQTGAGQTEPRPTTSAWPADVHVVGKDIVRFHAVYWPAMLMAARLPLPRAVVAHAHWTMNKSKMSKSRGNVVDPFEALRQFRPPLPSPSTANAPSSDLCGSVDILRWYLIRVGGNLATDSDYSDEQILEYHRKYLQGQIGNLASRMIAPKILGRLLPNDERQDEDQTSTSEVEIPQPDSVHTEDAGLDEQLRKLPIIFDTHMQRFEFSKALQAVHDTVAMANELVSSLEPWSARADTATIQRAIYYSTETLRMTAVLLGVTVMPERMRVLLEIMGLQSGLEATRWEDVATSAINLRPHVRLPMRRDGSKIAPLFPSLAVKASKPRK